MPVTLMSKLYGFMRTRLSGCGAAPGENGALAFPLMPNELLTAIVQQRDAGALVLPAPSTATTLKQWLPAARFSYSAPPEQAVAAPPSSWHRKVTFCSLSVQ